MTGPTICLISEIGDRPWLEKCKLAPGTIFVALTSEGQFLAETLGLSYHDCAELVDQLSKNGCHDEARRFAATWHRKLTSQIPELQELNAFEGYPLLDMLQSHLVLTVWEVLEAFTIALALIEKYRPSHILAGGRPSPFLYNRLFLLTGSRGLERECLATIAQQAGIAMTWMAQPSGTARCEETMAARSRQGGRLWQGLMTFVRRLTPRRSATTIRPSAQPCDVLLYAWGDHYLNEINPVIDKLRRAGFRLLVVLTGGTIGKQHAAELESWAVPALVREGLPLSPAHLKKLDGLGKLARRAADKLPSIKTDDSLFLRGGFAFFTDLCAPMLRNELLETLPEMCRRLFQSETLLEQVSPKLVFAHFSLHPLEICDVMPARRKGIATLGSSHGYTGVFNALREPFATRFFATYGSHYADALREVTGTPASRLPVIRSAVMPAEQTSNAPCLPKAGRLAVFCDSSGWLHATVRRHTTYRIIKEMARTVKELPAIELAFRMHHGADWSGIWEMIHFQNEPRLVFQISPQPPLKDMLIHAEVAISHHTSAVLECLAAGVPTVFLAADATLDPMFVTDNPYLKIAWTYDEMRGLVGCFLDERPSRDTVKSRSAPMLKAMGVVADTTMPTLADVIESTIGSREAVAPEFADWLSRVQACANFNSERHFSEFRSRIHPATMQHSQLPSKKP